MVCLQASGCSFLPSHAVTAAHFASSAGGSHGAPFHPVPSVTTLASPTRRTRPGSLPSPMALEFVAPQKMLSFAIQYLLSFRFYFMFMARTTFQVIRENRSRAMHLISLCVFISVSLHPLHASHKSASLYFPVLGIKAGCPFGTTNRLSLSLGFCCFSLCDESQAVRPLLAFSVFGEVMKMVLATMSSGLFSFLFSFVLAFEVLYFFLQCYISYTFLTMFFTVMF